MARRKRLAAAILCGAVCLALGSCARDVGGQIVMMDSQRERADTGVELAFFGYKADAMNLVAIENALRGFMEERPGVTITYEGIKGAQYWEAFEKRANAGVMDDIVMTNHDTLLELVPEGKLANLSDVSGIETYSEPAREQFTRADGTVYFLPLCITSYGLYINYDLLQAHGQAVPTNYAQFRQVCDYFVQQGITPVIANNYTSLRNLIVAKGMYPVYQAQDPEGEIEKFNRGERDLAAYLRPGLDLAEEFIRRGWIDCEEVLVTDQTSDDLRLFCQGERPFMMTGGWASPRVAAADPGFSYGVHAYPILDDGSVLVTEVNTCVSVSADTKHLDEAKQFLSYFLRPEVLWEYCESQSSYMPLKDGRRPTDETIAPSEECLDAGRTVMGSDYNLTLPLTDALAQCGEQMLHGMDAQDAQALLARLLAD